MTIQQALKLKKGDRIYCTDNDYHHIPLNYLMEFMLNKKCLLIVTRVMPHGDVHFEDTRAEHSSSWYLRASQVSRAYMSKRYDFMVYLKGLGDY